MVKGRHAFGQGFLNFASQIISSKSLLFYLVSDSPDIGCIIKLLILLPLQDCFREADNLLPLKRCKKHEM